MAPCYTVGEFEVRPDERRVLSGAPVVLSSAPSIFCSASSSTATGWSPESELLELGLARCGEENNLTVHVSALPSCSVRRPWPLFLTRLSVRHGGCRDERRSACARDPAQSASRARHLVGRAEALDGPSQRIQSGARLVSVLGLGGTGKTRLVTRYGRSNLGEFPGAASGSAIWRPRAVSTASWSVVARSSNVPLGRDDPVVQPAPRRSAAAVLVILDNFEQVARHARSTPLPMAGPRRSRLHAWSQRARCWAFPARTFWLYHRRRRPTVLVVVQRRSRGSDASRYGRPVGRCSAGGPARRLPLAIEPAAARACDATALCRWRMSERFKLLVSKGGRIDRQSTLRAAFDWSWDLLPPHEKAALAQLSVFEGGFTLEAAEAVIDLTAFDDAPWTVDAVHALVDKSFVRPRGDGRFDLLVSVQVYAAEHLETEGRYAGSGPRAMAAAQMRAIAWFAALGPIRAIEGRCADLDNLVTACRRAVALGDGESAAGALDGAWDALRLRGPFETGVELDESVCGMLGLNDRAAAHAQSVLGNALEACGRSGPARAVFDRALACARATGDRLCEARVMFWLGSLHCDEGRMDEARAHCVAAMQMAQELGESRLECSATNLLGNVEQVIGHTDESLLQYERALALARETGDRQLQGRILGNIANLHAALGRMDYSLVRCAETLAIARDTGDRQLEGNTLCNLGMVYFVQERLPTPKRRPPLVVGRELNLRLDASCGNPASCTSAWAARAAQAHSRGPAPFFVRSVIRSRRASSWATWVCCMRGRAGRVKREIAWTRVRQCCEAGRTNSDWACY